MSINGKNFEKRVKTLGELSKTKPIELLLVVPDADLPFETDPGTFIRSKRDTFAGLCDGARTISDNSFSSQDLPSVEVGVWSATDGVVGLPPRQTLERLVDAAVAAAHPDWFASALGFVDSRPAPPPGTGRELAMALMAGWYSHRYSEGFFEAVWEDESIARELEKRLRLVRTFEALEAVAS